MSDWMTILFPDVPPSPTEIQATLQGLGLPLIVVGHTKSWAEASGFWPMVLDLKGAQMDVGVEIYPEAPATFFAQHGFRNESRFRHGLWFRWGASGEALFCAHSLCSAFAHASDCAVYDNYHTAKLSVEDMKLVRDSVHADLLKLKEFFVRERDSWVLQLLTLMRRVDVACAVNTRVVWPNIEVSLIRDGLFHQHSTTTSMSSLGPPRYYHSFAVSAHLGHVDAGRSPFTIGGRCDAGHTIRDAFERDLTPARRGPQSEHSRRKGFEDIVLACANGAEDHLAPTYRSRLRMAAPTLLKCIELVGKTAALLQDEVRRKYYDKRLNGGALSAATIVTTGGLSDELGASLPEAFVCLNHAYLSRYNTELLDVARRLERLLSS